MVAFALLNILFFFTSTKRALRTQPYIGLDVFPSTGAFQTKRARAPENDGKSTRMGGWISCVRSFGRSRDETDRRCVPVPYVAEGKMKLSSYDTTTRLFVCLLHFLYLPARPFVANASVRTSERICDLSSEETGYFGRYYLHCLCEGERLREEPACSTRGLRTFLCEWKSDETNAQGSSLCLPRFSLRADKLAENILLSQQDLPLDSSRLPERAAMRDLLRMLERTEKGTAHGEDDEHDVLNFHHSPADTLRFGPTQSLRHRKGHEDRSGGGSSEDPDCADDGCLRRRLRPAFAQLSQTLNTIADAFVGAVPLPDSLESQREHFSELFRRLLGNQEDVIPSGVVHAGDDGTRRRKKIKAD